MCVCVSEGLREKGRWFLCCCQSFLLLYECLCLHMCVWVCLLRLHMKRLYSLQMYSKCNSTFYGKQSNQDMRRPIFFLFDFFFAFLSQIRNTAAKKALTHMWFRKSYQRRRKRNEWRIKIDAKYNGIIILFGLSILVGCFSLFAPSFFIFLRSWACVCVSWWLVCTQEPIRANSPTVIYLLECFMLYMFQFVNRVFIKFTYIRSER